MKQYLLLVCALVCGVLWDCGLIYASQYLIQSQAYVFNNIVGVYFVAISYIMGTIPSRKEWLGVLFAIIGMILLLHDPKAKRSNPAISIQGELLPALVDLGSAFFGVFYIMLCN